jgi:hypothetical protein
MPKMLLGLISLAAVLAVSPAWSQDVTVGPGRGGVDVGPRHDRDFRDRGTVGVAPRENCHTVHQRIQTPSGRVIYNTRRECR